METADLIDTNQQVYCNTLLDITYTEAKSRFMDRDYGDLEVKVEDFSKLSVWTVAKTFWMGADLKLETFLEAERKAVFCMAKSDFDSSDEVHVRLLQTVGFKLTGKVLKIKDERWTELGFQTDDPSIDLRASGLFSLLQMLYFLEYDRKFALSLLNYSHQNYFPFCCLLINLSQMTLELLREGYLIKYANEKKSVFNCLSQFFVGLTKIFYEDFAGKGLKMDHIGTFLGELKENVKGQRSKVFEKVSAKVKM